MPESERMRIRPLFSEAEGHPDVEPLQYGDNNSTGSWDVFYYVILLSACVWTPVCHSISMAVRGQLAESALLPCRDPRLEPRLPDLTECFCQLHHLFSLRTPGEVKGNRLRNEWVKGSWMNQTEGTGMYGREQGESKPYLKLLRDWVLVGHAFNPRTLEAKACRSLGCRTAWST